MSFLQKRIPTLLHPASGLLVLGLDWLLFSGGLLTLGISTPLLLTMGGIGGAILVTLLQRRYGEDKHWASVLKGMASGILIGLPLPIAGTGVGGLVLALSGLNRLRGRDSDAPDEDGSASNSNPAT